MKKKIWTILAAAMMALPLFAGASSVKADDAVTNPASDFSGATVNLQVKKLQFDSDTFPTGSKANDGITNPYTDGKPLQGAGFTIYDVTKEYYDNLRENDYNQTTASQALQKSYATSAPTSSGIGSVKTTDVYGQATFENLRLTTTLDNKTVFAAYLVYESTLPAGVLNKAVPMVIVMPVYKDNNLFSNDNSDATYKTIKVYPKNEMGKIVEKTKDDGTTTYNIGDSIGYTINATVPNDATIYEIVDTPTPINYLDYNMDLVVKPDGESIDSDDYIVTKKDGGFTFTLKTSELSKYRGKKLTLKYTMKLTASAIADQEINNSVTVSTGHTEQTDKPATPVFTGGYKFINKDANSSTALGGAEFIVAKNGSTTDYAKFDTNNKFTGWGTKEEATHLVSGADGTFSVSGLADESYDLYEVAAPDGYVLPTKVVDTFTIKATKNGTFTTSEDTINNSKKGVLPSTGGTGIYAFLAIGAALMVGAAIWYKKSKDTAEV